MRNQKMHQSGLLETRQADSEIKTLQKRVCFGKMLTLPTASGRGGAHCIVVVGFFKGIWSCNLLLVLPTVVDYTPRSDYSHFGKRRPRGETI